MNRFGNIQGCPTAILFVSLNEMPFPPVNSSRQIHVSKAGDDTNNGAPNSPVLTLAGALTAIAGLATPPSATNLVEVIFGPGEFTAGAPVAFPDYVYYTGAGQAATALNIPANSFGLFSDLRLIGFRDLAITNEAHLGSASGATGGAAWLFFENVTFGDISNQQTVRTTKSNYRLLMLNCRVGTLDLRGCNDGYSRESIFIGCVFERLDRYSEDVGVYARLSSCVALNASNMRAASTAYSLTLVNTAIPGMTNVAGNSAITLIGSDLGVLTITTGAPVITQLGNFYQPAVPGDWAGPAPTTLHAALDRLAAANPGA